MSRRSEDDHFDIDDAVRTERIALCDFLDHLDDTDWQSDSLCQGWTVHDVVAHLTLSTREGWWDIAKGIIAARGDFDRMTANAARSRSDEFSPPELIDQLRSGAADTNRAPMSSPLDPLADVLVHGQDIARPIGRELAMDPTKVRPALDHVVNSRWYGAKKRFADLRLTATDLDWSHGKGTDEVRGTAGDLLMVAAGRTSVVPALTGSGHHTLLTRTSDA